MGYYSDILVRAVEAGIVQHTDTADMSPDELRRLDTLAHYQDVALQQRDRFERVEAQFGCPRCDCRIVDWLVWDADGENVTCQNCGHTYRPGVDAR